MKEIPLTQGAVAIVDDADFERVSQHRWTLHRTPHAHYGQRCYKNENGVYRYQLLHRFILEAPNGVQVDHIDHNGLNCTRSNIRLATEKQNSRNKCLYKNNTSGYKGVSLAQDKKRWNVAIAVDKKQIRIGTFSDIIDAAKAYDEAALRYHGEFAYLNFKKR